MTDPNTDISGLVELLIAPLVEFPDEVEVTSTETEDGSTLIEVSVNPEDVGRVIGRQVVSSRRSVRLAAQLVHVMICASKLSLSTNERMGEDRKPR